MIIIIFSMGKAINLSSLLLLKLKEPQQGLENLFGWFFFFPVPVLLHVLKILSNKGLQIIYF